MEKRDVENKRVLFLNDLKNEVENLGMSIDLASGSTSSITFGKAQNEVSVNLDSTAPTVQYSHYANQERRPNPSECYVEVFKPELFEGRLIQEETQGSEMYTPQSLAKRILSWLQRGPL